MDQSRVRYEIAYDKTRQLVTVYPQWRGARPNMHAIGNYTPENPRANLEDYSDDLGEAVEKALARVGQSDLSPFRIMITPLDGSAEVMAKDYDGLIERVPVEDQVPVSLNTTAAEASEQEEENSGKPEPIPSAVAEEVLDEEPEEKKTSKKASKKASKD